MYNTDVKERFLREFETGAGRKAAAEVMFNATEPYESSMDSDICTLDKKDLQNVIDNIVGIRTTSKKLRLAILREYVRWCKDNNIPGAKDTIFEIKSTGLEKYKIQTVASPGHLQRYLDCICEKESEDTVDCVYRCFYWLAYSGIQESDALSVTSDNVDLEEMVIHYNGNQYPLYKEAIKAVRKCMTLTSFAYKHPNYIDKDLYKKRADGNMLLRGISNNQSITVMRVEMSHREKEKKFRSKADLNDQSIDLRLSYYRVWISGIFYKMYENERSCVKVDFMDEAGRFMNGKTYKLDSGRNTERAKQREIARNFKKDYERWKEAYSI